MTAVQLNYLNIGLMAISLVLAFILPFELFLFSYAFLGPLHYLTEISWLHDRNYFSPKKWDYLPLILLSFLILISSPIAIGDGAFEFVKDLGIGEFLRSWSYDLTFMAFGIALIFVLIKKTWPRVFGVFGVIVAAVLFHEGNLTATGDNAQNAYFSIFAIYMPTLIHVYLFTMLFMLYGALKRRSVSGQLSVLFMVFCAASCFIFFTDTSGYSVSEWAKESYSTTFHSLSRFALFHTGMVAPGEVMEIDLFSNGASVMLARFIAFAYTYHYLNWFSKTEIIGWHKVPKGRFFLVIITWVASIVLYLIDYTIGFRWLFLLSFAHVLLEFPLNHVSIIGIGQEVKKRFAGTPAKSGG